MKHFGDCLAWAVVRQNNFEVFERLFAKTQKYIVQVFDFVGGYQCCNEGHLVGLKGSLPSFIKKMATQL